MGTLENYDMEIVCKGCESECIARFKADHVECLMCSTDDDPHGHYIYSSAMIKEYMQEIQKCSKLV